MPDPFRTSHPRFDLVISDIDGCLSPESSAPMDVQSLSAIAAHNRLAIQRRDRPLVTLCSGRPQPFVEAMCRLIGNDRVPCIAENGVWLWDPRGNIYQIDPVITPEHRRSVREAAAWLEDRFAPRGVVQQPGKAASISLYHPDPGALRAICPEITEAFAENAWPLRVSMTWFYINCDLSHISKATGVRRLVERLGIPRNRLAGIGDTSGDLAIRDNVAFFACPANAEETIKPQADFIASQPEARGVLEILERL